MHLLLELLVLLMLLAIHVLLVLLIVGVLSSVGCAVLRTIQSPASRAPQASSAANDALLAEFARKNCAHLIGEPMCVSALSLPPHFKLPAGQEAHWHALQGMAFLGAAGGFFLGGGLQGLFLPKARRAKRPGPVFEWHRRDGGQPPLRRREVRNWPHERGALIWREGVQPLSSH